MRSILCDVIVDGTSVSRSFQHVFHTDEPSLSKENIRRNEFHLFATILLSILSVLSISSFRLDNGIEYINRSMLKTCN
jgi:hypothetical protein